MASELEQVVLLDKHCIVPLLAAVVVAVVAAVAVADEGLILPNSDVWEKKLLEGSEWRQRQACDWEPEQQSIAWERCAFLEWWSHRHHAEIPERSVFY